jgi:hypothetical protein
VIISIVCSSTASCWGGSRWCSRGITPHRHHAHRHGNREPSSPDDAEQEDGFGGSETFDSIDGCTEKDVGWMRIARLWLTQSFATIGAAIRISGPFSTNGLPRFLSVELCKEKDYRICLEWCRFCNCSTPQI